MSASENILVENVICICTVIVGVLSVLMTNVFVLISAPPPNVEVIRILMRI